MAKQKKRVTAMRRAESVTRNPVAKFNRQVNRAAVQTDRKKAQARGYQKHRSQDLPLSALAA